MELRAEADPLLVIDQVFSALPPGGGAPKEDRAAVEAVGGARTATYGEITSEGTTRLAGWLALRSDDMVYDLGSGVGRMPLQLAATTDVGRAVGVELSAWRHQVALTALSHLATRLPHRAISDRVALVSGDARTVPLVDATVVFVGATCFDDAFLARVVRNAREARRLRAFLCTRELPSSLGVRERASVHVPMTWAPRVRVHVYDLR